MTPYDTVRPLDQPRGWWLQKPSSSLLANSICVYLLSCERWQRRYQQREGREGQIGGESPGFLGDLYGGAI